jgi:transposase
VNLLQRSRRIFAYSCPVDMRKGFRGLEALVRGTLGKDPLTGDIFVGFIIVYKRLEHGKFRFHGQSSQLELDEQRLALLLDGMTVGGLAAAS